ncbi:hypothetical protein SmJEL517_g00348 [Synchytrium microbalum]|uniref:Cytochrome b5 heme-binding domain-containing protein n=1 Tax=Synchytrium microbalum TaxID=1806994 RepID=A0A507CFT4_9FUNG|nr:uncharacterized protein SmJEL517_g00348 [Synchytrium microbalum]TPX38351.1 hypothetical protein SmJEL517_g00348 [Synchytrium microbalum]
MGLKVWKDEDSHKEGTVVSDIPQSYYTNNTKGRAFTWKEVAKRNTIDNAWIIVRGSVYDITKFAAKHPGGRDMILLGAGRDATQARRVFETYHDPAKVAKVLEYVTANDNLSKYHIGYTTDAELPTFPKPSAFNVTLRKRISQYFKDTRQDAKFHPINLLKYFIIYASIAISYYLQFYNPTVVNSNILSLLCAIVLGVGCAQIGLMPMHDSSHASISHSSTLWWTLGSTHDFLNGASFMVWIYQHMFGHHPYTNIAGADPDVAVGDPDVRRIVTKQQWFSHYTYQHIWVPIAYAFLGMKVRIQDITILFVHKKLDQIRINPVLPHQAALFWGGKAFFVVYRILMPYLLGNSSAGRVFLLFIVADAISSYWLALMFQANHVVTDVKWPQPDENNAMHIDWAEMQVETTQDYQHGSTLWANLSGSLNYQAVHHIFPNINQSYYPELAPIVKNTAAEFGIRYRIKDTFMEAFIGHIDYLREMGSQPPVAKAAN